MVDEDVLRFQVSMDDVKFLQVFDTFDDLLEKDASHILVELSALNDVVKELTSGCELHDKEELVGCFDYVVKLNDVGMLHHLQ